MFYRKSKFDRWRKAKILSDVKMFADIARISELKDKAIPDPRQHNIISRPIDISREKALTGYIIAETDGLDVKREEGHQLKGQLKFILHTPFRDKFEHVTELDHTPNLTHIDYSHQPKLIKSTEFHATYKINGCSEISISFQLYKLLLSSLLGVFCTPNASNFLK